MSKKTIDVSAITNELVGASAYFRLSPTPPPASAVPQGSPRVDSPTSTATNQPQQTESKPQTIQPQQPKKATMQVSKHASMQASYNADMVEIIRKAVRRSGKEVTYVRLTPEEKNQLTDLVYTYKRQGTKTSENELVKIAINFILEDYQANGQGSVLERVLAALQA